MIGRIESHERVSVIVTPSHLLKMGFLSSDIGHHQNSVEPPDQKDYQVAEELRF